MTPDISVSRTIAAPADQLWEMVSDITRMGEWSPETTSAEWNDGRSSASVGARFTGSNRHGSKRWTTTSTVTACDPGQEFTFRVTSLGIKVADWGYLFEPTADGTTVTETWTDLRNPVVKSMSKFVSGVDARPDHNRASMEATLERLAAAAESA